LPFKQRELPTNSWAVPFVTGHRYKAHWRFGIDFSTMKVEVSPEW